MSPVRIALVNDYEVVVHGLAAMLRSYQHQVQVVELDANTPVGEPVDLALYDTFAATQGDKPELHSLSLNPLVGKVVVYSWNLDQRLVESALANGADGYLSKGLPAAELVAGILAVHSGERKVSQQSDTRGGIAIGDWPGREEGLTQREAEVLALITQGLSNAQIADRAHLSINSVKTYIRNCYRRIGVANRANAILWGVEHGFRPDRDSVTLPMAELAS